MSFWKHLFGSFDHEIKRKLRQEIHSDMREMGKLSNERARLVYWHQIEPLLDEAYNSVMTAYQSYIQENNDFHKLYLEAENKYRKLDELTKDKTMHEPPYEGMYKMLDVKNAFEEMQSFVNEDI